MHSFTHGSKYIWWQTAPFMSCRVLKDIECGFGVTSHSNCTLAAWFYLFVPSNHMMLWNSFCLVSCHTINIVGIVGAKFLHKTWTFFIACCRVESVAQSEGWRWCTGCSWCAHFGCSWQSYRSVWWFCWLSTKRWPLHSILQWYLCPQNWWVNFSKRWNLQQMFVVCSVHCHNVICMCNEWYCILTAVVVVVGWWPISQQPRAEAFSRPSAQPVSTQRCVCVCVSAQGRGVHICMCICVYCEQSLSSLFLVRWPHCASRPQHWPSRLNRPVHAGSQ